MTTVSPVSVFMQEIMEDIPAVFFAVFLMVFPAFTQAALFCIRITELPPIASVIIKTQGAIVVTSSRVIVVANKDKET